MISRRRFVVALSGVAALFAGFRPSASSIEEAHQVIGLWEQGEGSRDYGMLADLLADDFELPQHRDYVEECTTGAKDFFIEMIERTLENPDADRSPYSYSAPDHVSTEGAGLWRLHGITRTGSIEFEHDGAMMQVDLESVLTWDVRSAPESPYGFQITRWLEVVQ